MAKVKCKKHKLIIGPFRMEGTSRQICKALKLMNDAVLQMTQEDLDRAARKI